MKHDFNTEEELYKCFLKWQKRLGLQDWFIGLALVGPEDMEPERAGESEVEWVNKCGTIKILKKEYFPSDPLIKQVQEVALIHEMLHFKLIAFGVKSREEAFFDTMQHQLIEELARALFMAEYNLQPDWFIGSWYKIPDKSDKKGGTE